MNYKGDQKNGQKYIVTAIIVLFTLFNAGAQTAESEKTEGQDPIYKIVDTYPTYPGGIAEFQRYLATNLIVPKEVKAAINEEYARNAFSFIVEKDGTLSSVEVVKSAQEEYDALIKEILLKGPKWIPATQNGNVVRYKFIIPITMNITKLRSPR